MRKQEAERVGRGRVAGGDCVENRERRLPYLPDLLNERRINDTGDRFRFKVVGEP